MENIESDEEKNPHRQYEEYPLPEVIIHKKKCFRLPISIEPIVFSLFLADTISGAVIQNFILMRTCLIHFHFNQSVCDDLAHPENSSHLEEVVQPYALNLLAGMNFISKLFPAFLSLFLGSWSDHNGRKFIILVPSLGYTLKYILLVGFSVYPDLGPEYGLLVVVPVALTGGFTNFITGVYSYVSDISTEDNRSFRMSLIEAVMYFSVLLGLISCSYLLKAGGAHGYTLIFGFCGSIILVTLIPTFFFVPESVQTTENGQGPLKIFDCELLKEMFRVCFKKRENYKRAVIFSVMITLSISIGLMSGKSNVFYLYTKLLFGWDILEFNVWETVQLLASLIGLLLGSAVFTVCLKTRDDILGIISYGFKAISVIYLGLIPSNAPHLMFYNAIFEFFGGLNGPVGRAILSKAVPKEELGKVYALLGTTEAVLPLAVEPLYTILYNYTISTSPNAFLSITGGIYCVCTLVYGVIYFIQKRYRGIEPERLLEEPIND